jgi:hypothetical protein
MACPPWEEQAWMVSCSVHKNKDGTLVTYNLKVDLGNHHAENKIFCQFYTF